MKLELHHADCGYGRTRILSGASIRLQSGEIVCFLGPNGVGKTTLFKSMLGLLPLLSGEVLLDGTDRKRISDRSFARKVAYVPQSHIPPFPFRVIDIVVMGRSAHLSPLASPSRRDYAIAEGMMERLGISQLREQSYTRISGGERQMALIARALTQEPELILMDEPTANLDYGNQVRVLKVIRQLSESGLGVLMTSHDPDHAFLLATRAVLLTRERKLLKGSVDEVVTEENLRRAYGTRVRIVEGEEEGERIRACVPSLRQM